MSCKLFRNRRCSSRGSNERPNKKQLGWQTVATKKKNKIKPKIDKECQPSTNYPNCSENSVSKWTHYLIDWRLFDKNIQGTQLGKAVGHRAVVKSFSGTTTKAMKDYLKPNLELFSPDQVVLHVGTTTSSTKNHRKLPNRS